MKSIFTFFCAILICQATDAQNTQVIIPQQPIDWVNPLVGNDSDYGISNGNTGVEVSVIRSP